MLDYECKRDGVTAMAIEIIVSKKKKRKVKRIDSC